jgi:hypothetical protein
VHPRTVIGVRPLASMGGLNSLEACLLAAGATKAQE